MGGRCEGARTRDAFGRFLCLVLLVTGCQTVGGPASRGPVAGDRTVVVQPGPITGADQEEAARLLESARRSAEARRFFEVMRTTEEILTRFPASDASGEALAMTARAALQVDSLDRADDAADRYVALLGPQDPRAAAMRLVQARAAEGDPVRRLDRLLRIGRAATTGEIEEARTLAREAADSLAVDELRSMVDAVSMRGPVSPTVDARLAVGLLEADRAEESLIYARRAIEVGAAPEDLQWARGVLQGELPEGRGRTTTFQIAALLPTSGPPALAEYSREIMEGVELAVATVLGPEFTVGVVTADDEGDPELSAQRVAELEAQGVAGIVGFLQDEALESGARARSDERLLLVSPTARSVSAPGEAVYSLESADVQAATSIARYAASRAYQRIALLYPASPAAEAEANAFEREARSLGMPVVGRFPYEPGSAFFESQIIGARDALRAQELAALGLAEDDTLSMDVLEPVALFMPLPPEDVEFLAPQVIHFGLDTLAIEVLGTSGWTDAQTLAAVDTRLTDGVVATAPVETGSNGALRFRLAYEEHFQRSLVGTTPAVGYDAAMLLLEALRPGRVLPEQVYASFEGLADIEGATGVFTVVDGRLVRRSEVVRIQDRTYGPVDER